MKKFTYFTNAFTLLTLLLSGCFGNSYEKDFDALAEKAKVSGSSDCLVGTWKTTICGNKKLIYHFDGRNGYSAADDCNSICTTPLQFNFTYTTSGNTVNYNFTTTERVTCNGSTIAGPIPPTAPNSLTYTCGNNGNELTTVATNINTGVRTTYVFTRQ